MAETRFYLEQVEYCQDTKLNHYQDTKLNHYQDTSLNHYQYTNLNHYTLFYLNVPPSPNRPNTELNTWNSAA